MNPARASLAILALVAGLSLAQAAGGIKGQRDESAPRLQGLKRPTQQYLPPPPPPPPQAPRPLPVAAIKGPGQVAPTFSAVPVRALPAPAPIPLPPRPVLLPQPLPQPIFQQQQVEQEPEPQQGQQEQVQIQQQEQEPEPASQQQQEAEVDPNAAAQDAAPALIAPAARQVAPAASEEEANPRPEPYNFNYGFNAGDSATSGSSQRSEQQDASGKITGFYTLSGEDGRDRRVDYVADASGFRATISTNEMGTAPKDSADVDWQAQSPSEAQLRVAEAARQRALLNPQPIVVSQPRQEIIAGSSLSQRISSPRKNVAQIRESFAASSKTQARVEQPTIVQLQEPFEQIRQTEFNARARKSRHAPFYLFTV